MVCDVGGRAEAGVECQYPAVDKANEIICVVPDARKAKAVQVCLNGPISPEAPASILRVHPNATIYLDPESAKEVVP